MDNCLDNNFMENNKFFTIFNSFIRSKILSCIVAVFVLFGSINLLNFEGQKGSVEETVEESATVAFSQIFSVSIFSVKVITKLFVDTDGTKEINDTRESELISKDETKEDGQERSENEENASKASIGHFIVADIAVISEEIENEDIKDLSSAGRLRGTKYIEYLKDMNCNSDRKGKNIIYLMMLLLAILLSRRKKVGDNNIIKNNINIKK